MDAHWPFQLWEGEQDLSVHHIFPFDVWESRVISGSLANVKHEFCLWFGTYIPWLVMSETGYLKAKHFHICVVALNQFKATVVVNSLTVILYGESFHTWLDWGAAWLFTGLGKCEVVMLIGKGPDASKKSWSCQLCSVGFHSALTFCLVNYFFSSRRPWTPYWVAFPSIKNTSSFT